MWSAEGATHSSNERSSGRRLHPERSNVPVITAMLIIFRILRGILVLCKVLYMIDAGINGLKGKPL